MGAGLLLAPSLPAAQVTLPAPPEPREIAAAPVSRDAPRSGNRTFDRVVELVERRFYDPAALPTFRRMVAEVIAGTPGLGGADPDPDTTGRAIDRVLASLNASHTARYTPDQVDYYELADIFRFALRRSGRDLFPPDGTPRYAGIGIATQAVGDRSFVSDVYDGGPGDNAGLKVGDEILTVDGAPFSELEAFRGKAGRTAEVAIRRVRGGDVRVVPVRVERLRPSETLVEATADSLRVITVGERRLGVVRIWSYTSEEIPGILNEAMGAGMLSDVDGLVLDLRGRWGGAPAVAAEMFVGGGADLALTYRDGERRFDTVHWRKPLVGVIDEGTRSGMEILAYSLKKNGIALIGAPTAGNVVAGTAFILPDDSLLILAVADVHVDGMRLEDKPVMPDMAVPFELPYAAGRDPQMDAAVAELSRMLGDGNSTN